MLYAHGWDDLIDTREDGRPVFGVEQILKLAINAAVLYNHPFYLANRDTLLPIILMVTNTYADSVDFERSPVEHKRAIADVIRCCGNDVFFAVAMICGGWDHLRSVSPRIRERSWVLQHQPEN